VPREVKQLFQNLGGRRTCHAGRMRAAQSDPACQAQLAMRGRRSRQGAFLVPGQFCSHCSRAALAHGYQELLLFGRSHAQHVQTNASHHCGQPSAEIGDRARFGAAQAQPCVLHRIIGFVERAEACGKAPRADDCDSLRIFRLATLPAHHSQFRHRDFPISEREQPGCFTVLSCSVYRSLNRNPLRYKPSLPTSNTRL
jgi:hypothetical protein